MARASLRRLAVRIRRRSHARPIPLADAPLLDDAARRTRLVRMAGAVALVGAALGAFAVAPGAPGRRFLPANTVGIVVLDVSSSVRPETYFRIEHELATLAATRQRFGLVLFSDVAYEALPPGTPASELKPLLRFFAPPSARAKSSDEIGAEGVPRTPWDQWFSAGTRISSGLFLAAEMLRENHIQRGGVVLISDLADDPTDLGRLTDAVVLFEQMGVPLEIVGLDPRPENVEFFKNLLGPEAVLKEARLPSGAEARGELELTGTFPTGLAVLALLAIALLAANEWWAEPFRWRPGRAR